MSFRHRLRLKIRKKILHGVGKTKEETGKVSGGPSSEGEIQHGLVKGNMMSFRHRLRLKIREKMPHGVGKTEEAIRNESGEWHKQAWCRRHQRWSGDDVQQEHSDGRQQSQ